MCDITRIKITKLLKENFKKHRITNKSDSSVEELGKICNICENNKNVHDVLVYIKRNENNEIYFKGIEMCEKRKGSLSNDKIELVIINKDNYVYFREGLYDETTIILMIKKSLLDEETCVICYENGNNNIAKIVCETCCSSVCKRCIFNLMKTECPTCRNPYVKF